MSRTSAFPWTSTVPRGVSITGLLNDLKERNHSRRSGLSIAFAKGWVTDTLRALITESSLPLKAVEVDFAVDSSGFTTSRFIRWFDHKYGAVRQQHTWVKVHLMCGVKTNIVTAVEIRDKDASDTKLLPALVDATAVNFKLREVSGDKGYGSLNNYDAVARHGATPYIAFKSIHTGKGGACGGKCSTCFSSIGMNTWRTITSAAMLRPRSQ